VRLITFRYFGHFINISLNAALQAFDFMMAVTSVKFRLELNEWGGRKIVIDRKIITCELH
jgi:hypothetical protein